MEQGCRSDGWGRVEAAVNKDPYMQLGSYVIRARAHAHTHAYTHAHARTHAHTHTRTLTVMQAR